MEETTITIQDKKPYTGSAEKHPEGDFYADSIKYTCWDKGFFETFKEGDTVNISYTEKPNEYNGKTYINKNISKMAYVTENTNQDGETEEVVSSENIEHRKSKGNESISTIMKIGNLEYEVTLRLIQ